MDSEKIPDRHGGQAYPLRMPDDLRQQLAQEARRNRRSLNNELLFRLEQSLLRPTGPNQ